MTEKTKSMLCLGDSYTIGEAVDEKERFPMQTVEILRYHGVEFSKPRIIAKTGWTTDELATAINEAQLDGEKFDYVTLLIGVNNQYRGRALDEYRSQFRELLQTAIRHSRAGAKHVIVVSIPDWGVTPFVAQDGKRRTSAQIAGEIDQFNAINKAEAANTKTHYVDITPASRGAKEDRELIASDGLHPSGKMYRFWAEQVAAVIEKQEKSDSR